MSSAKDRVSQVLFDVFGGKPTGDEDVAQKKDESQQDAGKSAAPDSSTEQNQQVQDPAAASPDGGQPKQQEPEGVQQQAAAPAQGGEGGEEKIKEADVIAAYKHYYGMKPQQGQPDWKKILDEAPENARNRIALNLYFTDNHTKPDFDRAAYLDLRRELELALEHDDLVYLITTSSNESAKKHFRDLMMQLPGSDQNPGNPGDDDEKGDQKPDEGGQNDAAPADGGEDGGKADQTSAGAAPQTKEGDQPPKKDDQQKAE